MCSNEVKNPVRTLKTVTLLSLFTACIIYLLINIAYLLVVPLEDIKRSRELIAALFFERLFGAGFGNVFLPLAIALSAAGNVMVVTFSLARLNQEVARQGFLPWSKVLASSKPFGSPFGGLLVHFVPSALVIAIPPSSTVYAFIADVEGYAAQFFAFALAIGLLLLRHKLPEIKRPFRAWRIAIWIRIAFCAGLLAAPFCSTTSRYWRCRVLLRNLCIGWIWSVSTAFLQICLIASRLVFGVLYWYVWTVVLPKWQGYRLEEEGEVLDDGTVITQLVRKRLT